ncbi:AAA family ATPase [Halorussus marinus]|uniref:AAA family ATPase n=1 Tax=Halorussus marinus TaxID=2505976 RepID=UPI0010928D8B|nr:MoxR family ATPase [Halorussus marinus]
MSDRTPSIDDVTNRVQAIRSAVRRRIVGQERVVDDVLACMLCDGNALLESTPGLGKTLLVRTLAEATGLSFSRIQNTPDLMPSDVIGTEMVRETDSGRRFSFEKGPVFANLVLSDEINRATPKTQSALLEAMEEGQVTAGNETYDLPEPFFVLATQNPIDQEGTYPLPEAQSDRFLLKVVVDYPSADAEREIVDRYTGDVDASVSVDEQVSARELRRMQRLTHRVPIADDVRDLAVGLVRATRAHEDLEYGASPRASMSLVRAAKARALMEGRTHVDAADVTAMAKPVLRHRIVVDFRAEREGATPDDVIERLVTER